MIVPTPKKDHGSRLASSVLLISSTLTALSGFIYWTITVQTFSSSEIGRASSIGTSALFIVFITNLGLSIVVVKHAHTLSSDDSKRFVVIIVLAVTSSIIGGVAFLTFGPARISRSIAESEWFLGEIIFVFVVSFIPVAQLSDLRLLMLGQDRSIVVRASVAGMIKITLAVLLSIAHPSVGSLALCFGLLGPDALTGFLVGLKLSIPGLRKFTSSLALPPLRDAINSARVSYVSVLLTQGSQFATPFVLIPYFTDIEYANFYLAWSFLQVTLMVPNSIFWSLYRPGAMRATDVRSGLRNSLKVALSLCGTATLFSTALLVLVPIVFGSDFRNAGQIAPILVVSSLPISVTVAVITEARLASDHRVEMLIALMNAVFIIGIVTAFAAKFGLIGSAVGATIASSLVAIASFNRFSKMIW